MPRLLVSLLLFAAPLAAQIHFRQLPQTVVIQRLESAPEKNSDRQQALVDLFQSVGCKPTLQPVKHTKASNVMCVLPGQTGETVIVGGHIDHVSRGKGIVDDWSGAALLPSLYESLKGTDHRYTLVFVGFAEEEMGLVGSNFYVHEMTKEDRAKTAAMVNIECLGLTPTKIWLSHSDRPLVEALARVAAGMKIEVQAVNVERVGTADSETFAAAKIPRITIHSITQETFHVLHSDDDNLKAVHPEQYYESYRLIAGFLSALDAVYERNSAAKTIVSAGK